MSCVHAGVQAEPPPIHTVTVMPGGDAGIEEYAAPLRQAASCYHRVVLLGDSMGGTAALLFAGQATKVVAFCPQVDLARSAIRPAGPAPWRAALQRRVEESVAACRGVVDVHVGTWEHDQEQVGRLAGWVEAGRCGPGPRGRTARAGPGAAPRPTPYSTTVTCLTTP